ncbi:uncharacterized protein LOC107047008 [Diachasma alloeum]|uniref:uncharacterized protein LOC107047008 n=1 Tax=Diachasma alloeum TaxID=454923 RepID=UPI0007381075|nr:uncharacterized protein LOC107047008 [Diachasma alloeum]
MFKICEVRLVKMDIIGSQSQKLLNMEGRQGKFYLDGFAPHEFLKLTNLISNHGGIVMSPDDETIILSKPEQPSDIKNSPRFHVNWLYDSIRESKLQDIGKYLLPKQAHDTSKAITPPSFAQEKTAVFEKKKLNSLTTSSPKTEVFEQKKFNSITTSPPKSSTSIYHDNCTSTLSEQKSYTKHLSASAPSLEQSEPSDIEENVSPNVRKMNRTEGDKSMGGSQGTAPEELSKENKEKKKIKKQEKKKRAYSTGPGNALGENQEKRKRKKKKSCIDSSHSSFEQEVEGHRSFEVIEGPPNGFNSLGKSGGSTSPEMIDDSTNEGGEKPIVEVLLDTDFSDEEVNCESETHNESDPIGETNPPKEKAHSPREEKPDKMKKPSKPRFFYSYEENKRILQYLADHNLLSDTGCGYVWEKIAASEDFQNPPRNASGLQQHFNKILLPNYHKYTTDPNVIAALARKEKKKLKNIIGYFKTGENGNASDSSYLSP